MPLPDYTGGQKLRPHRSVMEAILREANFSDCPAIAAVKDRNGMPDEPWDWLWRENPALTAFPADFPLGWVIQCGDSIVGYLGNVPLVYYWEGKPLRSAVARGFAVDPEFRSHSIRLAAAFLSQKGVPLLLNTSANVPTSAIFGALKAAKIPQNDYDRALYWVVRPAGFLASACRRMGLPGSLAHIAGLMFSPVLYAEMKLRRRQPSETSGPIVVEKIEPQQAGGDFDAFWHRTLRDRPRCLLADRSAAVLRWRYGHAKAAARHATLFIARRAGGVSGYAVVTRENSPGIGLNRSRVVDLIAEDDEGSVIDHLLAAAHEYARRDGSHIMELIGFPERIRRRVIAGNPLVRRLPSWEFWYKTVDPDLAQSLVKPESWYGSPFDGDASL